MSTELVASVAVGLGLALLARGWFGRGAVRQRELAEAAELTETDEPDEHAPAGPGALTTTTVGLAAKMVDSVDRAGLVAESLERARLALRPGEFLVMTVAAGVSLTALLYWYARTWLVAPLALATAFGAAAMLLRMRIARRRKKFEAQLPGALSLVASSLSAGHTFLRAIQMMCEESDPPLSEEFTRLVSETRLGYSVVDALDRMSQRLRIRDLDWVVQAIRIQQTVGGKLADLLHTLADFIRDRDEVRREVMVLTAEGRISAYVLGALVPFLLVMISILNPTYMKPMFQGWGLAVLGGSGVSVGLGTAVIFRMVKIDV